MATEMIWVWIWRYRSSYKSKDLVIYLYMQMKIHSYSYRYKATHIHIAELCLSYTYTYICTWLFISGSREGRRWEAALPPSLPPMAADVLAPFEALPSISAGAGTQVCRTRAAPCWCLPDSLASLLPAPWPGSL